MFKNTPTHRYPPKFLLTVLVILSTVHAARAATTALLDILTIPSFFKPITDKESASKELSPVTYTFTGSLGTDAVGYIRLCTATDNTCSTCTTGFVVIDTGTPLIYGTTYGVPAASMAAYLAHQGYPAGSYNIGMYVQSSTTSASCGGTYCSTDEDTSGTHLLCMQATYSGGVVTNPAQTDNKNANLSAAAPATTLEASVNTLALSVTGYTEYGVVGTPSSGRARIITISNTGSVAATGLNITYPTFPAGTSVTGTTCTTSLAASSSCTITITPGATATSNGSSACTSGNTPTPGAFSITASNANSLNPSVVVLGYGCIYQGVYAFAFDDTTPNTGSVGGKVATTSDQAPNGIVWSSNGGTGGGSGGHDPVDTSYDTLPGIDETSTSATGSPTYATFASFFSSTYTNTNPFTSASFAMCNGISDGSCNTDNILTFYNQFITNNTQANGGSTPFTASSGPTNITYYAAGLCTQTIASYSDWYLPAICEMGYGISACGTSGAPTLQNIQSSLIDSSGLSAPAGYYWSSTERSNSPQFIAWIQLFASGGGSQFFDYKSNQLGVWCSRALTI